MSDIAVLRKALLSGRSATTSPIAQGIVIEVKGNFMIVEGVASGVFLVLSGLFYNLFCGNNIIGEKGRDIKGTLGLGVDAFCGNTNN